MSGPESWYQNPSLNTETITLPPRHVHVLQFNCWSIYFISTDASTPVYIATYVVGSVPSLSTYNAPICSTCMHTLSRLPCSYLNALISVVHKQCNTLGMYTCRHTYKEIYITLHPSYAGCEHMYTSLLLHRLCLSFTSSKIESIFIILYGRYFGTCCKLVVTQNRLMS